MYALTAHCNEVSAIVFHRSTRISKLGFWRESLVVRKAYDGTADSLEASKRQRCKRGIKPWMNKIDDVRRREIQYPTSQPGFIERMDEMPLQLQEAAMWSQSVRYIR